MSYLKDDQKINWQTTDGAVKRAEEEAKKNSETKEEVASIEVVDKDVATEEKTEISVNPEMLSKFISSVESTYKTTPKKEIHDLLTELNSCERTLKKINNGNSK